MIERALRAPHEVVCEHTKLPNLKYAWPSSCKSGEWNETRPCPRAQKSPGNTCLCETYSSQSVRSRIPWDSDFVSTPGS